MPFIGQKRNFVKHYAAALENIPGDGAGWIIIDAFGGSGLLAHIAKRLKPQAQVIYNDFDNYRERLANIADTNALRRELFALLTRQGYSKRCARISDAHKREVLQLIDRFQGYKDFKTLSTWLLFSGKSANNLTELAKYAFYFCIPLCDYSEHCDYLEGIEAVCEDFRDLLDKYKHNQKALFVLDPPYICTSQETYKLETFFDLIDFLDLTKRVRAPFILFSSTKSEFLRYMEFDKQNNKASEFNYAELIQINATVNHSHSYQDNLVFKFHSP